MNRDNAFEFRVSDSLFVPLRGQLLRLKLVSGRALADAVSVGNRLRVRAPDGRERDVRILSHSITGGKVSQAVLDRLHELDIVIPEEEASINGDLIGIGWTARSMTGSADT